MNISKLISELQALEALGVTQCRVEEDGRVTTFQVTTVAIDADGVVVDEQRRQVAQYEPYDTEQYRAVYEEGTFWKSNYPTFEDFYAFMEESRLKEVKLITEAQPNVALLNPSYEYRCMLSDSLDQ